MGAMNDATPPLHASDPIVRSGIELTAALLSARIHGGNVSLRLDGHLHLGELNLSTTSVGNQAWTSLLPTIEGYHVTLWSAEGRATLDADGADRIFAVVRGSLHLKGIVVTGGRTAFGGGGCGLVDGDGRSASLVVEDGEFRNCSTLAGFNGGGALFVRSGSVSMTGSTFEACDVDGSEAFGPAIGGGLAVQFGHVELRNVRFLGTHVRSRFFYAYGGGVGVWRTGKVHLDLVSFTRTTARSQANWAWGGGLASTTARRSWSGRSSTVRVYFLVARGHGVAASA